MTDGPRPQRRPDASMTLLTSMLERPLDPGYEEAATRREAAGQARAGSSRTVLVLVMMVLTGFLFAVGAQALRPKPNALADVKTELVSRIAAMQSRGVEQEATLTALDTEVRALESLQLQQAGIEDLTEGLAGLEAAAATSALKGPGLTLTLDDAPQGAPGSPGGDRPDSGFSTSRVTSSDLQVVVNGLWASGAEAMAINGHRLSATAAIRFAGQAIIVDFRPLTRPYVITALGDGKGMRDAFTPSFAGVYLSQLQEQYGIVSSLELQDSLQVPGERDTRLQYARPVGQPTTMAGSSATGNAVPTTAPTGRASVASSSPDTSPAP